MNEVKMLDLRYNEMWNDWNGNGESLEPNKFDHDHLVLSWKRLNVSVKKTTHKFFKSSETTYKQILHNVSGNVQCGVLLGIMGPSGSGKTTLIATISHRTKGNFDGELLLNGSPVSEELMIKISGFVPQHDISFEQLTTLEHLVLMARLKMDRSATKKSIGERIDGVVAELGLAEMLDTQLCHLSGGERKKLSLAVQLINDPPILFCDEMTTGLDSYSAAHVVNTLKWIARTGKIVVCTIHQPASGVFDKFDQVLLLSNGRLVYQGPVSMVNQLFQKFNYKCPDLFNKADYVISILNSDNKQIKKSVDAMCSMSSTEKQTDLNYDLFNQQRRLDYTQHLKTQNPLWITQLILVLNRSIVCILRSYKEKILELGILMFLGVILSAPYSNLQFDTKAVQNIQGFWFSLIINAIFQYCYTAIVTYQAEFPIIHREVSNGIYALSVYYTSQIVIMLIWTVAESLIFILLVLWIVGIKCEIMVATTFVINMLVSRSYGSVLSAFFEDFEHIISFSLVYDDLAEAVSGAYLSLQSLPSIFYYFKYFSIFFLGCETLSILQWQDVTFIPCLDINNCLRNGKEVLLSYGYEIDRFNTDLMILGAIYFVSYVLGYYGLLRRTKKQPAY